MKKPICIVKIKDQPSPKLGPPSTWVKVIPAKNENIKKNEK
jgi:hypothetical protein